LKWDDQQLHMWEGVVVLHPKSRNRVCQLGGHGPYMRPVLRLTLDQTNLIHCFSKNGHGRIRPN